MSSDTGHYERAARKITQRVLRLTYATQVAYARLKTELSNDAASNYLALQNELKTSLEALVEAGALADLDHRCTCNTRSVNPTIATTEPM